MWKIWKDRTVGNKGSSPSSSIFQSYTYGSGQMANSCYLDTFLESNYHPFIRQITPERTHFDHTTPAMDTLLESIVLRRQGSFHRSKMALWTYLPHHTSNGRTTIPLGQMAGIFNVFTALCSNMSQPEKNALFITDSVNIKGRKCNHCRNIVNTHSKGTRSAGYSLLTKRYLFKIKWWWLCLWRSTFPLVFRA